MFYENKGTETNSGSGHLVTKNIDYLFSSRKDTKNITAGLQRLPIGKIPPFQIHVPEDKFEDAFLFLTTGGGTPISFSNISSTAFTSTPIVKNGVDLVSWSFNGDTYTHPLAVEGRFYVYLILSKDAAEQGYYVEEFIMSNCCN